MGKREKAKEVLEKKIREALLWELHIGEVRFSGDPEARDIVSVEVMSIPEMPRKELKEEMWKIIDRLSGEAEKAGVQLVPSVQEKTRKANR